MLALLLSSLFVLWSQPLQSLPDKKHQKKHDSTEATAPGTGTARLNPRDGLLYVWIPAGKFMMGCSPDDNECFEPETPRHEVALSQGFWIGQTLVTQSAYQRVVKPASDPAKFPGEQQPIEMISWDEASAYCTAAGMRLPTEAEWEYAARAGNTSPRYGDLDAIAWYYDNSNDKTHEVARKRPNAWNLYDMLGNVWEWTSDWWDQEYYSRRVSQDPSGPSFGIFRVMRGGAVMSAERGIRVSNRSYRQPDNRDPFIGFRCVGNNLPRQ